MKKVMKVTYILSVTIVIVFWLMHHSINLYWQQAYHKDSPLSSLEKYSLWKLGGELNQEVNDLKYRWVSKLSKFDEKFINALNLTFFDKEYYDKATPLEPEGLPFLIFEEFAQEDQFNKHNIETEEKESSAKKNHAEAPKKGQDIEETNTKGHYRCEKPEAVMIALNKHISSEKVWTLYSDGKAEWYLHLSELVRTPPPFDLKLLREANYRSFFVINYESLYAQIGKKIFTDIPKVLKKSKAILKRGDAVFYVGDSLMQGVAPHARRALYKDHGIEGIDLSKQSTGLSYINFFNWPETVRKTFAEHSNIKLMVVYLGPNDPWDFARKRGEPYMKFKSKEWESVYRSRIQEIIQIAQTNNARVLWLGVPNMKRKQLNEGIVYLNDLFESEVQAHNEFYQGTREFLGSHDDKFTSFVQKDGRNIKVRTNDGIHFTIAGQRIVAENILNYIYIDIKRVE